MLAVFVEQAGVSHQITPRQATKGTQTFLPIRQWVLVENRAHVSWVAARTSLQEVTFPPALLALLLAETLLALAVQ